jgi:hypothetical protein
VVYRTAVNPGIYRKLDAFPVTDGSGVFLDNYQVGLSVDRGGGNKKEPKTGQQYQRQQETPINRG